MVCGRMRRVTFSVLAMALGAGIQVTSAAAQTSVRPVLRADSSARRPAERPLLGTPIPADRPLPGAPAERPLLGTPASAEKPLTGGMADKPLLGTAAETEKPLLGTPAEAEKPLLGTARSGETTDNKAARPTFGQFTQSQLDHERVLAARIEKRFTLKQLFRERGIEYPAAEIFFRIFKRERVLEVWARDVEDHALTLVKTYPICALAGKLGPKRAQGDNQTPEGFYYIDSFNPSSGYFLSLHINYPNRSDRILTTAKDPGGDIVIHGGCETEGCLAVTDDAIKELYWMAVETRDAGQQRIPVHIFPARLDDTEMDMLVRTFANEPHLTMFWANLKQGYEFFENTKRVPMIDVDDRGRYRVLDRQVSRDAMRAAAGRSLRSVTSVR